MAAPRAAAGFGNILVRQVPPFPSSLGKAKEGKCASDLVVDWFRSLGPSFV